MLAGFLELAEAALGLFGFATEADGAAAKADDAGQGQIGLGGLGEGFEGLEAEADDLGGEAEFVVGLRVVGTEDLGCGVAGGGQVAVGADEEERGEAGQDGFEDGRCEVGGEEILLWRSGGVEAGGSVAENRSDLLALMLFPAAGFRMNAVPGSSRRPCRASDQSRGLHGTAAR